MMIKVEVRVKVKVKGQLTAEKGEAEVGAEG